MLEEKIYLLQLVKELNKGGEVSVPSINRCLIRKYPEIIYQGKLKTYLSDLKEEGYLIFVDAISLQLTPKGECYLCEVSKRTLRAKEEGTFDVYGNENPDIELLVSAE